MKKQSALLERMEHIDGWRNRAALAKILLEDPDVLLMDEPTNFLDIEGQAWLEAWFQSFRGGLIVVSHDRHFLDSVVTRLVEIENYRFQEYVGDYTNYVRDKRLRLKTLERQFEHEEELLALESEAISSRAEARKNPSKALNRKLADVRKRSEPRLVDQIVTGLAYDAPRKIVNRFLQLLRFSAADLNQRIGTLSGGQRARVALAKCFSRERA